MSERNPDQRAATTRMGLYLIVIAVGAVIAQQRPLFGFIQICFGAFIFVLYTRRALGL